MQDLLAFQLANVCSIRYLENCNDARGRINMKKLPRFGSFSPGDVSKSIFYIKPSKQDAGDLAIKIYYCLRSPGLILQMGRGCRLNEDKEKRKPRAGELKA